MVSTYADGGSSTRTVPANNTNGELFNQRPTRGARGNSRVAGNCRSPNTPSITSCSPNSIRPLASNCAVIRTTWRLSNSSGELRSQRPTSALAGNMRTRGSKRSAPHAPSPRTCRPNSVRPLSRRFAEIRTVGSSTACASTPAKPLGVIPPHDHTLNMASPAATSVATAAKRNVNCVRLIKCCFQLPCRNT